MRRQVGVGADMDADDAMEEQARGLRLLERYFAWAPSVDRFWPVRVETDFAVQVPDPRKPGHDLVSPEMGEIRYEGRIPMLMVDEADAYWIVQHHVVSDGWTGVDELLLDEEAVSACWAWERFYLGMRIAGTIVNELRADLEPQVQENSHRAEVGVPVGPRHRRMYVQAASQPAPGVVQEGDGPFRRTRIARSQIELECAGEQLAWEALDMVDPNLRVYPNPSPEHCRICAYRRPCLAVNIGEDPGPVLTSEFRQRPRQQVEEGRLGGVTWSMSRGAMPMDSRAREHQRLPQPGDRPGGRQ